MSFDDRLDLIFQAGVFTSNQKEAVMIPRLEDKYGVESHLVNFCRLKFNLSGVHSTAVAFALQNPGVPGSNLCISMIFSEIFLSLLDVAVSIDSKDSAIKA